MTVSTPNQSQMPVLGQTELRILEQMFAYFSFDDFAPLAAQSAK